jgi:acyl-coenzyme A synthetase/AMP-(fatty) acid ligase
MALVGGALLSPASVQMVYRRTGLQLKRLYGATEAGIMCADLKRDEQSLPRLRPMSGVSMTIRPLSNVISAVFPTVGEPYFRRTHMARSYWGDPERTASAFSDGWYKSGDAVICNDDGSVAVLGRVDDVWINPDSEVMHSSGEVSASLVDVEGVTEVAVIPPKGEALSLATVFCTVDPNAHLKKVEAEIASILSAAGVRANIYLSNEWPRTLVGKPDRRALLAWVQ